MSRLDPSALTPPVPPELDRFLAATDPRPGDATARRSGVQAVGRPGKVGVIHGALGVGASGHTVLRDRFVKAPMHLTRPLYVDPTDPDHACVYLCMTGGGIAENDRIGQRFRVASGASATVTTQEATNVHRMNAGFGSQWTVVEQEPGSVVEYLPWHTTLFAGSRLVQSTDFDVAPGATLMASEVLLVGRLARGECHEFDALALTSRVVRDGLPLMSDTVCVVGRGSGTSEMLFSRWPVWGTLLIVPAEPDGGRGTDAVVAAVRDACPTTSLIGSYRAGQPGEVAGRPDREVVVGVTTMVADQGVVVRVAGHSPVAVRATVQRAHDVARWILLGRPAFDLRCM
ncbi:urease accessory protein UreD [Corynebacterium bovis]|uniref:urease accessory protein UreD n=1 Tax=Corynebacterium bovis TaxID=36808 RepID=UPI003138DD80